MLKHAVNAAGFGFDHVTAEFMLSDILQRPVIPSRCVAEPLLTPVFIIFIFLFVAVFATIR